MGTIAPTTVYSPSLRGDDEPEVFSSSSRSPRRFRLKRRSNEASRTDLRAMRSLDPRFNNIDENVRAARRRVKEKRDKDRSQYLEVPRIKFVNRKYGQLKPKKKKEPSPPPAKKKTKPIIEYHGDFNLDFNSKYEPRFVQKERYKMLEKSKRKPFVTRHPTTQH